jgi:hypothetical protein
MSDRGRSAAWRSGFRSRVGADAERVPRPSANAAATIISIVGLACSTAACLPDPALASRRDHTATREYLRASYGFLRAAYARVSASVASIDASASEIAAACPGALTYAPRDAAFTEIGEEARGILQYSGAQPLRPLMLRLAEDLRSLSWRDRALTKLVRARAAEERSIAMLTPPELCAEIAAWKASDYAALPQGTSTFVARLGAIESSSNVGFFEEPRETVILRRITPYEGRASRALAKRIEALEARFGKRLSTAVASGQKKVTAALGVSAL